MSILWVVLHLARKTFTGTRFALQKVRPVAQMATGAVAGREVDVVYTFRCSTCNTNWPHKPEYKECLDCLSACSPMSTVPEEDILTAEEALSRKRHAEFEDFYEERHRKLVDRDLAELQSGKLLLADDVIGELG